MKNVSFSLQHYTLVMGVIAFLLVTFMVGYILGTQAARSALLKKISLVPQNGYAQELAGQQLPPTNTVGISVSAPLPETVTLDVTATE